MGFKFVAAALAALLALLLALRLDPGVTTAPMQHKLPQDPDGTITKVEGVERITFSVLSHGKRLHCWLFVPPQPLAKPPPAVVAAYGLGVQKDIAMVPLALALAREGFAAVLFDYRHWGVSEGLPRHAAVPQQQVEDLTALLQHLGAPGPLSSKLDSSKMALYGASLGGGVVLAAAAELCRRKDPLSSSIKAVVAAIPFVSGSKTSSKALQERGLLETARVGLAVVQDLVRSVFTAESAVYIPLARSSSSSSSSSSGISAMQLESNEHQIWASRTPLKGQVVDGAWENKLAARSLFWLSRFEVEDLAAEFLEIPTLLIAGSIDTVCPIEAIRDLVSRHQKKQSSSKMVLKEFPLRHFDFLTQQNFPILVSNTVQFIKEQI
ncbi:hypothetical protein, conserved [Eimeria tenella]|uniref:Serine aminopeptidase S33 domain-containing protein n=1 Tax=Eimeria tenella TaxID=5802 RepID=U6KXJ3_EIMTE|nr:hypothetical protein, conserved [Eimeria tenella]CDJ41653.1 hypothetical protein, conserved [Eimeria tenella]|eukprot:XP_013232403.1 hypothetical protein, conserved [Eimeria tenella]